MAQMYEKIVRKSEEYASNIDSFLHGVRDLFVWGLKNPKKSIPLTAGLGGAVALSTCKPYEEPNWKALYVAEVSYNEQGDQFGHLIQIGDTLITNDTIIDNVVNDILDKNRPNYVPLDGMRIYDKNGNLDHYRFFVVDSDDSADDVRRNTSFPSTRAMLPEELQAAADSITSRYEAEQRRLDREARQEYNRNNRDDNRKFRKQRPFEKVKRPLKID